MADAHGLIADIGATNARFALTDGVSAYAEKVLKCADYPSLAEAADAYLDQACPTDRRPTVASMAIAGPVNGDRFSMINHGWDFSIEETRQSLKLRQLAVMNDFKALALAVPHLERKDVRQCGGSPAMEHAPIGIIGPGTGLGVASLVWSGEKYLAIPGEGGHVTMPAKTQREFDLFRHLIDTKYSHVSAERVCSGKGLVNIYNGLKSLDGRDDLPERTPEEISRLALSGACALCAESLSMMMGFLGRIAGNLALTLWVQGGIYIAGGIVPQLGDYFHQSPFREEFENKGRYRDYMKEMPVFVIQHPFPAFIGLCASLRNAA